jgi:hypothetical protein
MEIGMNVVKGEEKINFYQTMTKNSSENIDQEVVI